MHHYLVIGLQQRWHLDIVILYKYKFFFQWRMSCQCHFIYTIELDTWSPEIPGFGERESQTDWWTESDREGERDCVISKEWFVLVFRRSADRWFKGSGNLAHLAREKELYNHVHVSTYIKYSGSWFKGSRILPILREREGYIIMYMYLHV